MARRTEPEDAEIRCLHEALVELRGSSQLFAPEHGNAWRALVRFVSARSQAIAASERDDVVQETLLAIARTARTMQASDPRAAAKWVSTILRNKRIDMLRASRRPDGAGADEELGKVPAPEPPGDPRTLQAHLDRVESVVLAWIERELDDPMRRALRRVQARAALFRLVHDLDIDEVMRRLAHPEPIDRTLLFKWIERGRAPVAAAMRAWARAASGDEVVEATAAVVIELVEARRADAGKSRPARRAPGPQRQ